MNLAKATEALSKKDSERTEVNHAIEELNELSDKGVIAKVKFSVFQIDGRGSVQENDLSIGYDFFPLTSFVTEDGLSDKGLKDVIKGSLKSKDVTLSMKGKFGSDGPCYSAKINLKNIPENKEYRDELIAQPADATSEDSTSKIKFHLKILYDNIEALLDSKKLELEQVEKEFKVLGDQVKEAKRKPTKKKEQGKSPKKKAAKKGNVDVAEQSTSIVSKVMDFAMSTPSLALTHRAFVFFGVAAVGIFFFGEEASV